MTKVLLLGALVLMLGASFAVAQESVDVPDCVTELDPCGPFVNSTTARPPATCCRPLADVIENDVGCLCTIFGSIDVIQTLSLNVTEALTLPQRCGIQIDLISSCQGLSPEEAPTIAATSGLNEVNGAFMLRNIASTESIILKIFVLSMILALY